jgi:hypothetical protein
MDPIEKAIEDLKSQTPKGRIPYTKTAEKYGVVPTTLRRRYLAETKPCELKNLQQQLLTLEQEKELVKWIKQETQGHQPPARSLVASKASLLAGRDVGINWVHRFYSRHHDQLVYKNSTLMDRLRH